MRDEVLLLSKLRQLFCLQTGLESSWFWGNTELLSTMKRTEDMLGYKVPGKVILWE